MSFGDAREESAAPSAAFKADGDVEAAVIGHGQVEGPFTVIDGLAIERDPQFPIRVTVQFYKATSDGIGTEADVEAIAGQIERVCDEGDYVGGLVGGSETYRPTEHDEPKYVPPGSWESFCHRFENNLQFSRWEAMDVLKEPGAVAWQWL